MTNEKKKWQDMSAEERCEIARKNSIARKEDILKHSPEVLKPKRKKANNNSNRLETKKWEDL